MAVIAIYVMASTYLTISPITIAPSAIVILVAKTLNKALSREVIIEVTPSHKYAIIHISQLTNCIISRSLCSHNFLTLDSVQVSTGRTAKIVFIVEELSEPSILIPSIKLTLPNEKGRKLICEQACISCANSWSLSVWVNMRRSLKIISCLKLILIAAIFEHVFVVLHISRLEILL